MSDQATERIFQDDIIRQLLANGWLLGSPEKYTSSRKEAVRYKQCFDKYIADKGYQKIHAMVAFSGEVEFTDKDPAMVGQSTAGLIGEKFTETNMNPNLKKRDMRKAFDSDDYQVMNYYFLS